MVLPDDPGERLALRLLGLLSAAVAILVFVGSFRTAYEIRVTRHSQVVRERHPSDNVQIARQPTSVSGYTKCR